ncbi:MAG: putative toxin-antitoxin system toxin component, PIN family [Pyrinomonadaceae bacterium]|nr:putative toxin-antitoxin system toxin component, PIN family [Pyrinomonadaceae bacterium]MBP6214418.1 putative toxin-antitoxin system toxin component, PIN family [Pyrinomonadaceae bacterium]
MSALLMGGAPRSALDTVLDNGVVLVSTATLLELADVLGRPKFDKYLTEDERMRFLVGLLKQAEMVDITEAIEACRDPRDNKFLELAVCGRADVLISGDEDLLVLDPFRNVTIVTPQEFSANANS